MSLCGSMSNFDVGRFFVGRFWNLAYGRRSLSVPRVWCAFLLERFVIVGFCDV